MLEIKKIVRIYKALSDLTRLRIINILSHGDFSVCELQEILSMGQSKISRHLAYLKNAGLVRDRRKGFWVYYSLNRNSLYVPLFKGFEEMKKGVKKLEEDLKRLERHEAGKDSERSISNGL